MTVKENYYNFLRRHAWSCLSDITILLLKRQYGIIFEELEDVSRKTVECLTEEETEVLRKFIGVYEKKYTMAELSNELNVSSAKVSQMFGQIGRKLKNRIFRGYANLQDAVLKGIITKEELLNMELRYLDNKTLNNLYRCSCYTIRDVVEISYDRLSDCPGIGNKKIEEIVDYIHSLGLVFDDEYNYRVKLKLNKCNDSKESLDPKGQLGIIYKKIEKDEEKCDKIIEKQMNKKQELIEYRKRILEISSQLSEVPKVNKIGTR